MTNQITLKSLLILLVAVAMLNSCRKERPQLGPAPTEVDATFTATPSAANPNIIEFALSNTELLASWDFDNGLTGTGSNVTSDYPYAGTYTVTVRIFTKGGSAESSQEVVIAVDDPSLINNPIYTMLTGGPSGPGFKTWHVDSATTGHMGVGPDPISGLGNVPEWWQAGANEKPGCGLYDDRYVFHLVGFEYDMINNGDVYVHNTLAADFPGSYENLYDYTAPYTDQLNESWTLTEGADTTISVSGSSFIGFYSGVSTYKILSISDTELWLQYKHACSCPDDGALHWYLRLIPE
jgi:hypothetical protein